MKLDAQTLFLSMFVNVTLISIALFLGVHWKSRSGIHVWAYAMVMQALGWAALIAAYTLWPRHVGTLGVAGLLACFSLVHVATKYYLAQDYSRAWVYGVPVVATALHWIVFDNFAARAAIVNTALGMQMWWVTWLLLRPNPTGRRWRWLAAAALASGGSMVMARAGLVLVAPESYPTFEAPHWINIFGLFISNANLTICTLAFLLAHRDEAEQELQRLATVDGLTGLLNRRSLLEHGASQFHLAQRHGHPMAVLMLDIDFFKKINDTHGHQGGDRTLMLFAQTMQATVRQPDLVGRYGGEEFCVLLPVSGVKAAEVVDRRLRELVQQQVSPALGFALTYSAGLAETRPEDVRLDDVIARADQALYAAKADGRNCMKIAD